MKRAHFDAWVSRRRYLVQGDEELALLKRLARCTKAKRVTAAVCDGAVAPHRWSDLPANVRAVVFDYLVVIPQAIDDDFNMLLQMVYMEDPSILTALKPLELPQLPPPACVGGLSFVSSSAPTSTFAPAAPYADMFEYLLNDLTETYPKKLGEFAVWARMLQLPPSQPSAQRSQFIRGIRAGLAEVAFQQSRLVELARWVAFREEMLASKCSELRYTIREDLTLWRDVIRGWRKVRDDITVRLVLDELTTFEKRIQGVEYLGQDTLAVDDIRNMLWDVNLKTPENLPESYAQSLTMAQVMTMGIVDLPWVAGYTWECRDAPGVPVEDHKTAISDPMERVNSALGARAPTMDYPQAGTAGSRSHCSTSRIDRTQQLLGLSDALTKKQEAEFELEQTRLEALNIELRQRAHQVAADGMTQRLWISTRTFLPRWKHQFCGCEICSKLPIFHVGLKKENSGAVMDIVLCEGCFQQLYADEESVANRMYTWFVVKDLITPDDHS